MLMKMTMKHCKRRRGECRGLPSFRSHGSLLPEHIQTMERDKGDGPCQGECVYNIYILNIDTIRHYPEGIRSFKENLPGVQGAA